MKSTVNKNTKLKFNDGFILMAVIFFALFFRIYDLNNRPLHVDEAVHAVKFGDLLENGFYKYDPIEYHGPTLNYFTFITAKLAGVDSYSQLTEYEIRLVPALVSSLCILLLILLFRKIDNKLGILTGILLAISPMLIFYGRYYIQETLLVSFAYLFLILIYRYYLEGKVLTAVLVGIYAGLIYATKETSIIIFGTAAGSAILLFLFDKNFRNRISFSMNHLLLFIVSGIIVSILFYSSFFSNWEGVVDSIKTFANYFSKAGSNSDHIHPWYYYISLLLYSSNSLISFSEVFLAVFSIIGIYFSFAKENQHKIFIRFIAVYSILQLLVYSAIPYKTPWLAVNFWIGFLILSAFGILQIFSAAKNIRMKGSIVLLIVFGVAWNIWQSYIVNFKYPHQPENPFTYSQAEFDVVELSKIISTVAETSKDGENILINVTSPNYAYWPLPWYLRKFKNVAWYSKVDTSIYNFPIIISVPELENDIINILYNIPPPGKKNLYVPLFDDYLELRPGVELRGYIQKDVLDLYNRSLEEK